MGFMTFNHLINYIKCKDPMTMKGLILISNNNSYVYPILIYLPKFTQLLGSNGQFCIFVHNYLESRANFVGCSDDVTTRLLLIGSKYFR